MQATDNCAIVNSPYKYFRARRASSSSRTISQDVARARTRTYDRLGQLVMSVRFFAPVPTLHFHFHRYIITSRSTEINCMPGGSGTSSPSNVACTSSYHLTKGSRSAPFATLVSGDSGIPRATTLCTAMAPVLLKHLPDSHACMHGAHAPQCRHTKSLHCYTVGIGSAAPLRAVNGLVYGVPARGVHARRHAAEAYIWLGDGPGC